MTNNSEKTNNEIFCDGYEDCLQEVQKVTNMAVKTNNAKEIRNELLELNVKQRTKLMIMREGI